MKTEVYSSLDDMTKDALVVEGELCVSIRLTTVYPYPLAVDWVRSVTLLPIARLNFSCNTIHTNPMRPMQKKRANLVQNYKNTTFAIIEKRMNDERTEENRKAEADSLWDDELRASAKR